MTRPEPTPQPTRPDGDGDGDGGLDRVPSRDLRSITREASATDPVGTPAPSAHPLHVGIIMDGNGRWAQRRGLPRLAGHRAGARTVRRIVSAAPKHGIGVLTLYAFSSDNWRRPALEVRHLMSLLRAHLRSETRRCIDEGVRLSVIGRRDRLDPTLVREIEASEEATRTGRTLHLQLAIDYSAREAILRAAQAIAATAHRAPVHDPTGSPDSPLTPTSPTTRTTRTTCTTPGELAEPAASTDLAELAELATPAEPAAPLGAGTRGTLGTDTLTADTFRAHLSRALHLDAPVPDVDLLIRTGGEQRLSDFLLWESAYAELVFTPRAWPDFEESDLCATLAAFTRRDRRFGGLTASASTAPPSANEA